MSWQSPDILSAVTFIRRLPPRVAQNPGKARISSMSVQENQTQAPGEAIAGSDWFEKVLSNSTRVFETGCRECESS